MGSELLPKGLSRLPQEGDGTNCRAAGPAGLPLRGAKGGRLAAALIAAAAGLLSGLGASSAAAASACPPRGADTIASGYAAVAYETGGDVLACYRRTGKRYFIGSAETLSPGTEIVEQLAISGRFVAWGEHDTAFGLPNDRVFRLDVRSGRTRAWASGTDKACPDFCGFGIGPVHRVVVNPRGSVAWVAAADSIAEVWRFDGNGRRMLARGDDIDASFLRRRNNLVEWRQGGLPRRAPLEP